jgi:hypothetical protein
MEKKEGKIGETREAAGNVLKYGGLIGGVIGLAEFNPVIVLFSAGAFIVGNKLKGEGALHLL